MASVSTPGIDEALTVCGLAEYVVVDTDLQQLLDATIQTAAAYTALAVGAGTYDSTSLTARQVTRAQHHRGQSGKEAGAHGVAEHGE